jgi:P pilus assembly chaperone PapD
MLSFLSAFSLLASPSFAAGLELGQSSLELGRQVRTGELSVSNTGAHELHLQARVFAWAESASGEMLLEPTPELSVSPSRFVLAAGQDGQLHVTTTAGNSKVEGTYRVVLTEVAPFSSDVAQTAAVPVFVEPKSPARDTGIANGHVGGQTVALDVVNRGNAHVRLQEVDVVGRDTSGAMVFASSARGGYVLAGATRSFDIAFPADKCLRIARFDVSAPSDQGTVTASLPAEPLACGQ